MPGKDTALTHWESSGVQQGWWDVQASWEERLITKNSTGAKIQRKEINNTTGY